MRDVSITLPLFHQGTRFVAWHAAVLVAVLASSVSPTPAQAKLDLSGRVVDASRMPVVGATVYIYTAGPRTGASPFCPSCYPDCGKHRSTATGGRFSIPRLDDSLLFRVLVVAKGFVPMFAERVDPAAGPLEVQLAARDTAQLDPAKTVRGRVVDPEGHAVVGATVDVEGIRRGIRGLYGAVKDADPLAVTDTNGDFFLATADSAAALMVRVSARGLAPRYFDEVPIGPVPSTLRLSRGGTLSGRVLRDGRPVAGVVVAVTAEGGYFMDFSRDTIATGRDGTFSFVNLPCNRDYRLAATMRSLGGTGATRSVLATLGDEDSITVAAPLEVVAARRLSGRVVLSDGQTLPPRSQIMLSRESDVLVLPVGRDGRFEAACLPPEAIILSVAVPGYRLSSHMPPTLPRRYGTIALGMTRDRDDVQIILEPESRRYW